MIGPRSADFIRARGHQDGRTKKPDTWQQPVPALLPLVRPCHAGAIHTWLYLAAVEDLYSRRVVGWALAGHRESRLVVDALELAVQRRLPGEGLLAHSDRGSQCASEHYQCLVARHGITCGMSRRVDCRGDAPME
ncbi:MAG: DDE-type integrase/transposase/recombinase, partial [Geminicoccaceae bacterium]